MPLTHRARQSPQVRLKSRREQVTGCCLGGGEWHLFIESIDNVALWGWKSRVLHVREVTIKTEEIHSTLSGAAAS